MVVGSLFMFRFSVLLFTASQGLIVDFDRLDPRVKPEDDGLLEGF